MSDLLRAMRAISEEADKERGPMLPLQAEAESERLAELFEKFIACPDFKPGELVGVNPLFGWNKRYPRAGQPAIVLKNEENPRQQDNSGQGWPEDTLIMVLDKEGPLAFWVSKAELLPWEQVKPKEEKEDASEAVA